MNTTTGTTMTTPLVPFVFKALVHPDPYHGYPPRDAPSCHTTTPGYTHQCHHALALWVTGYTAVSQGQRGLTRLL